jgi:hypothetical protein
MARSVRDTKNRTRPPKTTGAGVQIGTRWQQLTIDAVDAWAKRQDDRPSRPEAIRRLVELGLSVAKPRATGAHKGASEAKSLARAEIEKLSDRTATDEERQHRRRRLLKGPEEFRDMRTDLPKRKT